MFTHLRPKRLIEAPAVIYTFKNRFQLHSGSVQAAKRRSSSDQPAQRAEEVNLERTVLLPLLLLPHWGQQSTIFSSHSTHTHTHTFTSVENM